MKPRTLSSMHVGSNPTPGGQRKHQMAERVGFEPTEGTRMINKLLKSQEFEYPQIPSSPRIWHLIWH